MKSPQIDFITKDYRLESGQIANSDAIPNRMYMILNCPKGSWLIDPDFGWDIYSIFGIPGNTVTKTSIARSAKDALNVMLTDGTLLKLSVVCTFLSLTKATLEIYYVAQDGVVQTFVYNLDSV